MGNDWRGSIIAEAQAGTAVQSVEITLQPNDIMNMLNNPVTILPAQGPGTQTFPIFAVLQYDQNTTDYNLGSATQFFIGPAPNPMVNNVLQPCGTNLINGSNGPGSQVAVMPQANVVLVPIAAVENVDLVITQNGNTEFTMGDGTLFVVMYYIMCV